MKEELFLHLEISFAGWQVHSDRQGGAVAWHLLKRVRRWPVSGKVKGYQHR